MDEINDTLADLTEQLGTPAFKRGTPQRAKLDARIAALSARQDELSSAPSEPAGWRFEPTGEVFQDWWAEQDDEAKNIWLRQMDFRFVWRSHTENGRTLLDFFGMDPDHDMSMSLDADQLFGLFADLPRIAQLRVDES